MSDCANVRAPLCHTHPSALFDMDTYHIIQQSVISICGASERASERVNMFFLLLNVLLYILLLLFSFSFSFFFSLILSLLLFNVDDYNNYCCCCVCYFIFDLECVTIVYRHFGCRPNTQRANTHKHTMGDDDRLFFTARTIIVPCARVRLLVRLLAPALKLAFTHPPCSRYIVLFCVCVCVCVSI